MKLLLTVMVLSLATRSCHSDAYYEKAMTEKIIREAENAQESIWVIHEPDQGCPLGWKYIRRVFIEKKKQTEEDACVLFRSYTDIRTDYLRPEETEELHLVGGTGTYTATGEKQ